MQLQGTRIVAAARKNERIFADASGVGAEWIPDVWMPELDRYIAAPMGLEAIFPVTNVSNKVTYFPRETVGLRPYLKNGATDDNPAQYTPSSITTANSAYTVPAWALRTVQDEDATADSIIADADWRMQSIAMAVNGGFEDALVNGATGTHPDTALASWDIRSRWGSAGLGTATDHRRAFDGLRARAIATSNDDDASATMTYATLCANRAKLAAPLMGQDDVVLIVSPEIFVKHLLPLEAVATVDKFGPNATVLKGQLAQVGGMPIIVSEFLSADLQTTGRFTTTGGATTGFLIVARNRFHRIVRKGSVIESERDITRGIVQTVFTARKGFRARAGHADTTEKNVWFGFNVTP
jgi:hypothetical protein